MYHCPQIEGDAICYERSEAFSRPQAASRYAGDASVVGKRRFDVKADPIDERQQPGIPIWIGAGGERADDVVDAARILSASKGVTAPLRRIARC